MAVSPPPVASAPRRQLETWSIWRAVLRKNLLIQTRSRKTCFGLGGSIGVLLGLFTPSIFFLLIVLAQRNLPNIPGPATRTETFDAPSGLWDESSWYERGMQSPRLLFAPDLPEVRDMRDAFAKAVSCPGEYRMGFGFPDAFPLDDDPALDCTGSWDACMADVRCWGRQRTRNLQMADDEASALDTIMEAAPRDEDRYIGVVVFDTANRGSSSPLRDYTIRLNHTSTPDTNQPHQLVSDPAGAHRKDWMGYWFFLNTQLVLDRAIIGRELYPPGAAKPAPLEVSVGGFPWPAYELNLAGGLAGPLFTLLMVVAFMLPTRATAVSIVQEKELRLREGMLILGLSSGAYWAAWATTHFVSLSVSGLLCAGVCMLIFKSSSFWLLATFFQLSAAALVAFAFALSTLFSTSRVAGGATPLLFMLAFLPGFAVPLLFPYGHWLWTASAALPPSAMLMFGSIVTQLELGSRGLTSETLWQSVAQQVAFSAGDVLSMLAISCILFSVLTWYLDQVLPAALGVRRPFYFPLQPAWWREEVLRASPPPPKSPELLPDAECVDGETGSDGKPPAVQMRRLTKTYPATQGGVVTAVDGLTLDIPAAQITGLLGHNGAGKTTTIGMLCGMIPPTRGTAYVDGRCIRTEMPAIRRRLGLCPQFDILWPALTVREHLNLFATIKGYSRAEIPALIERAVGRVDLAPKLDECAGDLSGGQRRKLSVAIAFLGDPAVVFLDEPTSGMDPYARRFTWDVIRAAASECAIVLTTHSMEEADTLCDGIVILAAGSLAARGSALDLKSEWGEGYSLRITCSSGSEEALGSRLAAVVEEHVSDAVSEGQSEEQGGAVELRFRLPSRASPSFAALLRGLETVREELHISDVSLTVTSLEEVFITISDRCSEGLDEDGGGGGGGAPPELPPALDGAVPVGADSDQFAALLKKRALSARRDRLATAVQVAAPLLLVGMAILTSGLRHSLDQPPLPLDPAVTLDGHDLPWGASPGARNTTPSPSGGWDEALAPFFARFEGRQAFDTGVAAVKDDDGMEGWLGDHPDFYSDAWFVKQAPSPQTWSYADQSAYNPDVVKVTLLANQTAIHALPTSLSQLSSTLLRWVLDDKATGGGEGGEPSHDQIRVTSNPLPLQPHELTTVVLTSAADFLLMLFLASGLSLLAALSVIFVVREKESQSKLVQVVSGARPLPFWASHYAWDGLINLLSVGLVWGLLQLCDVPAFHHSQAGALSVLLVAYIVAALPLTYLLGSMFRDEFRAVQRLNSIYFIGGYVAFVLTWILGLIHLASPGHRAVAHWLRWLTLLFRATSPHYCLLRGLWAIISSHHDPVAAVLHPGEPLPSPWAFAGLWLNVLCMLGHAVVYGAALLALEAAVPGRPSAAAAAVARVAGRLRRSVGGRRYDSLAAEAEGEEEDADVAAEAAAVSASLPGTYQVALRGVEKAYDQGLFSPPVRAVRRVSLGIQAGECFGLLGTNGAGKSTIFKLLTGEMPPTAGDCHVAGYSTSRQPAAARQRLGYTPQMHGLPNGLTGREVLHMYGRLRGMRPQELGPAVDLLLRCLSLSPYADRQCEHYSGGNRRKLGVAVALVGGPPVLLLDEPSTGMDPKSRHFLRDFLRAHVAAARQTVVLTSHSMEECEALCSRLGIMLLGRLKCLGSSQHLKATHGNAYILELRATSSLTEEQLEALPEAIAALLPAARLSQRYGRRLLFMLNRSGLDLPGVFDAMEQHKEALGVENYSVSQTTLEQVFLALAHDEQPPEEP